MNTSFLLIEIRTHAQDARTITQASSLLNLSLGWLVSSLSSSCLGLRLHPNLYVEGKVCLSLLDTWNGKGSQMWDPSNSNLLQVAVSLQGLVLGQAKPYFMEAG